MFGLETCREEQVSCCNSLLQDQGAQVCRQVQIAAGACSWEMCYGKTSYKWEISQLTARERAAGFLSGFLMGKIFCEKQRIMGHPWGVKHTGAWTTCNGRRKGGKGLWSILLWKGTYIIQKISERRRKYLLYSLVMKLFVITTCFCLNSLEDFKVFHFLKGNFVSWNEF